MQSTGQTSTQAVSFVSMQGSVMMNGMLASLRKVRDGTWCPAVRLRACRRTHHRRSAGGEPDRIGRPSGPEPANYTARLRGGNCPVCSLFLGVITKRPTPAVSGDETSSVLA